MDSGFAQPQQTNGALGQINGVNGVPSSQINGVPPLPMLGHPDGCSQPQQTNGALGALPNPLQMPSFVPGLVAPGLSSPRDSFGMKGPLKMPGPLTMRRSLQATSPRSMR